MPEPAELPELATRLRRLHEGPLFVLPNAWDAVSARVLGDAGFPAVATASAAVAAARGYPDNDSMAVRDAFDAVATIAGAVDVPVSADLEAGYGLEPAELVGRMLESGAVGLNLEDTDHHGSRPLLDAEERAEYITEIKRIGRASRVDLVVNARVDVFLREVGAPETRVEEAVRRGRLYRRAGADCVYPIWVQSDATIQMLVAELGAPVNVLVRPGTPSLARLAALGVARVTFGPGLQRVAMEGLARFAARLSRDLDEPVYRD
jgi:2-methylisocitrate lyase-like PEP mutase family enzyme